MHDKTTSLPSGTVIFFSEEPTKFGSGRMEVPEKKKNRRMNKWLENLKFCRHLKQCFLSSDIVRRPQDLNEIYHFFKNYLVMSKHNSYIIMIFLKL